MVTTAVRWLLMSFRRARVPWPTITFRRTEAKSDQLAVRCGEAAPARAGQTSADGVRGDNGSPAVAVGRAVRHEGGTPWARGAIWRTRG